MYIYFPFVWAAIWIVNDTPNIRIHNNGHIHKNAIYPFHFISFEIPSNPDFGWKYYSLQFHWVVSTIPTTCGELRCCFSYKLFLLTYGISVRSPDWWIMHCKLIHLLSWCVFVLLWYVNGSMNFDIVKIVMLTKIFKSTRTNSAHLHADSF